MRTTNNMLINNMMYYMTNNMDRLSKYQTQMATGKKIAVPSDDPIAAARALKYRTDVSEVIQFQSNAGDASSWMDTTESTIGDVGDILQTLHERAIQAANNGPLTAEDESDIQLEAQQLRDQIIHLANTTYAGRYIFSGYSTDTKLMNADGTYAVSVSSDKTAVIKSNLMDLTAAPVTVTTANNKFKICLDGATYTEITVAADTYNTLDDLAAAIQSGITAAAAGHPELQGVDVKNVGGRLEFSLKVTTDANGNKLGIYMKEESTTSSFLKSINIQTTGVPGMVSSKSEDINYQMGIGDVLNVNVLGTELFGSGVEGDMGELILKLNRFIDALSYSDDRSYISGQSVNATNATPLDFSATGSNFKIQLDGPTGTTATINIAGTYDGTAGHTMADLINNIQGQLTTQGITNATVAYQNGKIVFSADPGHQITLTEGTSPAKDALSVMKVYTDSDRTITSVTGSQGLQNAITDMSDMLDLTLRARSDIGARMNRAELTSNRLSSDEDNFTKLMSDNEDADISEVILNLTNEENVYKASLSAGARIIQPSLIDFLK